jgi:hypothetical protein
MKIDTALLCDAATERDGLLNVLGGGITVATRPEFPAPLAMTLALRILVHPTEVNSEHKIEMLLQDADGGLVTKVDVGLGAPDTPPDLPPGEEPALVLPWSFPGNPILPHAGRYSIEILIDGVHQRSVGFTAQTPPTDTGGNANDT